jgi:hypothetical protein
MLAFQLMFNGLILLVCAFTLLVVYRAVQKQEEDIADANVGPTELFKEEPRSNPWVGFLQEPMSKIKTGRTGTFSSYQPNLKHSPMYMIT